MLLGDLGGALRRRWLAALLCLLLIGVATGMVVRRSEPTYSYSSSMLLLPPEVTRATDPGAPDFTHGNPLFYLGSLDQTRDILIAAMTSKATQEEMAQRFPGTGYTVTANVLGTGPVLVLRTESTVDASAAGASRALAELLPRRLQELQSQVGVPGSAMITTSPITQDTKPSVSHKQQIRQAIMTAGALGLLGLFFVGVLDALLVVKKRRREPSGDAGGASNQEDFHRPLPAPVPSVAPEVQRRAVRERGGWQRRRRSADGQSKPQAVKLVAANRDDEPGLDPRPEDLEAWFADRKA